MKKLLYTTSALVGAAFLMEAVVPAKAEVNMSMRYRAALISKSVKDEDKKRDGLDSLANTNGGSDDATNNSGKKFRSNVLNSSKINIDLSASKDHPNGLTTGASLAIATSNKKLDYDNAIGYVSGSFGKFEVGDFHDVGYRALGYGTPGTSNFGAVDAGFQPSGGYINTSATGNIGGRGSSIAYWSPSFSGAQIGVSWSPQVAKEGRGGVSHISSHGDVEDSIGLTATYSGSFGGTGVSMGVSFEQADTVVGETTGFKITNYQALAASSLTPESAWSSDIRYFVNTGNTVVARGNPKIGTDDGDEDGSKLASGGGTSTKKKQNQDPSAFAGYISFDIGQFSVGGSYGVWESSAANAAKISESTAYALGASYSVDAITFGIGYAMQSTETTHHDVRVAAADAGQFTPQTSATTGPTIAQVNTSSAFKQELDSSILAFTTSYQLGDGAALDFVIEQGNAEKMHVNNDNKLGKRDEKTTGFGVGIDLKF